MIKKGFTLAELLVAMAIVGVVASLTTPWLMTKNKNAANASKLSTIVSDLENNFSSMVVNEQVDSLIDTTWYKAEDSKKGGELAKSIAMINPQAKESASYSFKTLGEGYKKSDDEFSIETQHVYTLKNGAIIYFTNLSDDSNSPDAKLASGGNLGSKVGEIYIDVNGNDTPNIIGRDVFNFALGADGSLFPVGGKDFSIYTYNDTTSGSWDNNNNFACNDTTISDNGRGCTGRVVAEGYKITY